MNPVQEAKNLIQNYGLTTAMEITNNRLLEAIKYGGEPA